MKKLIYLLFLCVFVLSSCEKSQIETNQLLLENDNLINNIAGVTSKDLIDFFGVESTSNLITKEFKSTLKSDHSILAIFDSEFDEDPELADKVIYLDISEEIPVILNVFEKKTSENEYSRIEISVGLGQDPNYIIEYDLDLEYTNFYVFKTTPFEDCVDDCLHDILDGIFNQGSWLRRARFILSAPVEMGWHIADCTIYCL